MHSELNICSKWQLHNSNEVIVIFLVKDIPRQTNGFDCGVFVSQFALYRIRGVNMNFQQVCDLFMTC